MNSRQLLTLVSVTVLVGTEVLGASLALGWAIGGLMGLSRELTWGIVAVCLAGGIWATWRFYNMARRIEPQYP